MKHWYIKPGKLLIDHVSTVLIMEGSSEPGSQDLPIFTNGLPTLFCKTEKDAKTGFEKIIQLTLYGMSAPSKCLEMNNQTTIIAYFLKPFVLPGLFNISARELKDSPIEFSNWSPHEFNALKTQLAYADSTTRKIEVLENLMIGKSHMNGGTYKIIQYATEQIMCNPGVHNFSEIIEKLNLTERTFQRMFKKFVGVTPTQYRRICQFQLSFSELRSKRFSKLSEVAFNNNFSDQSHFIRSFKEFTQTTPNDYLRKGLTGKD